MPFATTNITWWFVARLAAVASHERADQNRSGASYRGGEEHGTVEHRRTRMASAEEGMNLGVGD